VPLKCTRAFQRRADRGMESLPLQPGAWNRVSCPWLAPPSAQLSSGLRAY
jgi:hypothetical protein